MKMNRFIISLVMLIFLMSNYIGFATACCGVTCANPCTFCSGGGCSDFSCVDCGAGCTGCCTSCTYEEYTDLFGCVDTLCVVNLGSAIDCPTIGTCEDKVACSDDLLGSSVSSCSEYVDTEIDVHMLHYTRHCKNEKCPNVNPSEYTWPEGNTCLVAKACWDGFGGCEMVIAEGYWDVSEKQCVQCGGRLERRICGTTSDISGYITWDGSCPDSTCGSLHLTCWDAPDTCEQACWGVDEACDEVAEGGFCRPGLNCDSLFEACDGTQKCVACQCEGVGCSKAKGDECETDADCGASETCDTTPGVCKCTGCGNGVLDAGETCDPGVPGNPGPCTGVGPTGIPIVCAPQGTPHECDCQICGDGTIQGNEQCEQHSDCASNSCDLTNCVCLGAPPPPPPGACSDHDCETESFTVGQTKSFQDGTFTLTDRCYCCFGAGCSPPNPCNAGLGSTFSYTLPDGTTGETCFRDHNAKTFILASTEVYTIELKNVITAAPIGTVTIEVCCEAPAAAEDCHNDMDDDGNGDIDCEDAACPAPACGSCKSAHCDSGGTYDWDCELTGDCAPPGTPSVDCAALYGGNPSDWECLPACTCDPKVETGMCGDHVDNDHDGCTDGEDIDCGGTETDCNNTVDDNCDGEIDCGDPDCALTAPDCNDCQILTCNAGGTWQWSCPTDFAAGAECSTNEECSATTHWCNLETCKCEEPPPPLASKWRLEYIGCRIIILLQAIAAAIATLILVYAGIKWMGSGVENPQARTEAADMIKAVFVGLVIIIIALQLLNTLFGAELGSVVCP